VTRFSKNNIQ